MDCSNLSENSSDDKDIIECVKARLLEEGREARNLIAYSLPLQEKRSSHFEKPVKGSIIKDSKKISIDTHLFKKEKRHRSVSAGRRKNAHASLRARHWGFLFRNLQLAVDEIYQTCEDDESIIECKEAILMLERYTRDFRKLIDWLKIKWEYENTPPPQRPTSLTWEIRTSSPGKLLRSYRKSPILDAIRALNFEKPREKKKGQQRDSIGVDPKCCSLKSPNDCLEFGVGVEESSKKLGVCLSAGERDGEAKENESSIKEENLTSLGCEAHRKTEASATVEVRGASWSDKEPAKEEDSASGPHIKPGPLVNMNKASEVRQAFNRKKVPNDKWKHSSDNQESRYGKTGLFRSYTTLEDSSLHKKVNFRIIEKSSEKNNTVADGEKEEASDKVRDSLSSSCAVDDDEGWELVKRGRRGHSGSSSVSKPKTSVSRPGQNRDTRIYIRNRFQMPSSATSMPSLAYFQEPSKGSPRSARKASQRKLSGRSVSGSQDDPKSKKPSEFLDKKSNPKPGEHLSKESRDVKEPPVVKEEMLENSENSLKNNINNGSSSNVIVVATENKMNGSNNEYTTSKDTILNGCSVNSEVHSEDSERCSPSKPTAEDEIISQEVSKSGDEQEKPFIDSDMDDEDVKELLALSDDGSAERDPTPPIDLFCHYDPEYAKMTSMSWADQIDALESIEEMRPPGRVLHIHEKLSSPSRKLPISEKFRRHTEKLAKAEELRGKLLQAKAEKLKDWFKKIDDVNTDKERMLMRKRDLFERKMERAEEKRRSHLQEIINKAHDEDNKAKEIAFINGLEAQNKLHDIMQQHQSHESRLADRAEERSRRQEEKAAKEAAAQERRKALEAERQARMEELCERRRRRFERIDRRQAEKREELLEQKREKARDREERLSALQQAQLAKESELVKKIQQKLEETTRRHEENIEQIRQRALESSIMKFSRGCDDAPKLLRYENKKLCTLCNSLIATEVYLLSHLRGKHHQDALKDLHRSDVTIEESEIYNIKFIVDAPANIDDPQVTRDKERQKALKKRCRKIRTRMLSRGSDYLKTYQLPSSKETPFKARMSKSLAQIGKLLSSQGIGPWPPSDVALLDRHLLELLRVLDATNPSEQLSFLSLNGMKRLFAVLNLISGSESETKPCVIPSKSLTFCAKVVLAACRQSAQNCGFILCSNLSGQIIDLLMQRFDQISSHASLPSDSASAALMELLAEVLKVLTESKSKEAEIDEDCDHRLQDVVAYCVSVGVADKISWYFNHIQNPVDNDPPLVQVLLAAMNLLSMLTNTASSKCRTSDPTQIIGTFHVTEACGVVSLMYGLLLHQGGRSTSPPPEGYLSPSTLAISAGATNLLHSLASLDLHMFQTVLGGEGISLEFRHISSFLLWFCSHWPSEDILHNIISLVGFFTVNNKENQMVIQSGETPSVLQQLCSLPWRYFSEKRLTTILFPTLLACSLHNEDNQNILQQEMSFQVLEDFLKNKEAQDHTLMQILQKTRESSG